MTTRAYERRPDPWPLRLLGWLFRGILVLLIMIATIAAVITIGASVYYELTRTKAGDVEEMIEKRLPTGSSAEHISAVLDEEGIENGAVEPFAGDDLDLLYAGVRKGDPVILATARNDGFSLELVDVRMAFVLDEGGALRNAVVYERHYQPEWLDRNLDAVTP